MTLNPPRPGQAAVSYRRPFRARVQFFLAAMLAILAVPAFAQQMPSSSLAADSADAPAAATSTMLPEAMGLSDRALLLATDLNRLFAPGAVDAAASVPPAQQGKIATVLQRAMALLGTPYRWGGTDPNKGFDCSGLVGYVFRNALGIDLPRVSREMAKSGELVTDRAKLSAGDLVFFGRRGRVDHVGIYVGEGRFVHAPSRGKDVQVSSMDTGYWSGKFMQARRLDGI